MLLMRKFLLVCLTGAALGASSTRAERPYYNDKKIPDTREDLLAIQDSLRKSLGQARKATICIQIGKGSGSGVIVSEDGLIMTAAHVTAAVGKKMKVVMEDGTELDAISLGLHSEIDASLLQITTEGKYPFVEVDEATTAESSELRLGDWVFALGHSGGFDKARGSVVRLGRIVRMAENTIQSDCKLIGGDSGGPLFDMNGRLIAIHSRVGKVLEQNMHVPMHVYHTFDKQLRASEFIGDGPFAKRPVRGSGFIGLALEKADGGLKVTGLFPKAPGEKAGVKVGDLLLKVNDDAVKNKSEMKALMKKYSAEEELVLTLSRDGEVKEIKVTLEKR